VARVRDQRDLGASRRVLEDPEEGRARRAEAAVEEVTGALEHDLEVDGGEHRLDGLLHDLLVDVVHGDHGGERHGV